MYIKIKKYRLLLGAVLLAAGSLSITSLGLGRAQTEEESAAKGPGVVWETSVTEREGLELAQETEQPSPVVENGQLVPERLSGAEGADQLIVVVGTGGCGADISYYRKNQEEGWNLVWKEGGVVGRGGITPDKREGDKKTPSGTYQLTMAFGLKEDPGSILPYHKIVKGDYWVDDGASSYYNKLVNTGEIPKSWNSAENMLSSSPYYNYGLALNYNPDCVPGMGSAIFLHCFTATPDNGSAGCIRLPEERVMELVQSATERTRIVIAPDLEQLR